MQLQKYVLVTALLILGLVLGSAEAQATAEAIIITNLVTNGSFETGTDPPTEYFRTLNAADDSFDDISGWIVTGSVDWVATYWTAQEGERSLDLSGSSIGAISTTIDTSPEVTYLVTFYLAGNFEGGEETKRLKFTAGDASETFYFAKPTEWSTENMGWTKQTTTFTADDYSTQLTFASLDNNAFGPALDNVTVGIVPLPPAALLLGSGLLGLLGWSRRKNK
ncbi:MAG: choice-of-anchor C family protein [Syntrophobacterales bacterium]|jgi:choice-of-anchor C domain-containing protein